MIRSLSTERLRGCTSKAPEPTGPVIEQARPVVDYAPCYYERDAPMFTKDEVMNILTINASELWKDEYNHKMGGIDFFSEEILPMKSRRKSCGTDEVKPGSITEVLKALDMEDYLQVFVLNGYENLSLFKDLDDEELDYLGISDEEKRKGLLSMAQLLFPDYREEKRGGDNADHYSINSSSDITNKKKHSKMKLRRM